MAAAIVKLDPLPDPVWTAAQDDDPLVLAPLTHTSSKVEYRWGPQPAAHVSTRLNTGMMPSVLRRSRTVGRMRAR